ncbi:MAG TPA: tetratricopeptide repeat protein [Allosphingosinicella sp.]
MGRLSAIILAMAAFGAVADAQATPRPEERRIFETQAGIRDVQEDGEDNVYLHLWPRHMRFRLAVESLQKRGELLALIEESALAGRSIRIRYDGTEGRFVPLIELIDYPACAFIFDDRVFAAAKPCGSETFTGSPSGEAALGLSFAHLDAGHYATAKDWAERSVGAELERLKLYARASATESLGALAVPGSEAADRLLISALADYRRLAALDPQNDDLQFDIGGLLEQLGAYREARAHYESLLSRFPDEEFSVRIRLGALRRQQGEYERALDELDRLVASLGPQEGMKYDYHRGWTLLLLNRFEDAVKTLDRGLEYQPDYAFAFEMRSCAHAGLGQLDKAVADMEKSTRLLSEMPNAADSQYIQGQLRQQAKALTTLRQGIADGGKPILNLCKESNRQWEEPRVRSPLLPAA